MQRNRAMSLRFLPILKKAELAYAIRSAWLHLTLTAILTLGITIWSRSTKAMAQALMTSCSSLLNTLIFAANQSSASCTLCCCSSSTACDIAAARSCSNFSTVFQVPPPFFHDIILHHIRHDEAIATYNDDEHKQA